MLLSGGDIFILGDCSGSYRGQTQSSIITFCFFQVVQCDLKPEKVLLLGQAILIWAHLALPAM